MISSMNYELVKWFDIDLGDCMVMGSSLGELTLNFIFLAFFGFDVNMERWEGNLSEWAAKKGWKGNRKGG